MPTKEASAISGEVRLKCLSYLICLLKEMAMRGLMSTMYMLANMPKVCNPLVTEGAMILELLEH